MFILERCWNLHGPKLAFVVKIFIFCFFWLLAGQAQIRCNWAEFLVYFIFGQPQVRKVYWGVKLFDWILVSGAAFEVQVSRISFPSRSDSNGIINRTPIYIYKLIIWTHHTLTRKPKVTPAAPHAIPVAAKALTTTLVSDSTPSRNVTSIFSVTISATLAIFAAGFYNSQVLILRFLDIIRFGRLTPIKVTIIVMECWARITLRPMQRMIPMMVTRVKASTSFTATGICAIFLGSAYRNWNFEDFGINSEN